MKVILPLAVTACLFVALGLPASAQTMLQGGVEHTDTLPPVPPQYQPGNVFSGRASQKQNVEWVQWFPIPSWFAGTWQKQGDERIDAIDMATGSESRTPVWIQNVMSASYGYQTDNTGAIWHAVLLPFTRDGVSGLDLDQRIVNGFKCLQSNQNQVTLLFRATVVSVNQQTGRIDRTYQSEEIITYTPINNNQLHTMSSARFFNQQGRPVLNTTSTSIANRTAPFVPVKYHEQIDLEASLANYLRQNNMAQLVPGQQYPANQ